MCVCVCVCVCVIILFILDVRLGDVPARASQEEGHTGFLLLPSAVLTSIFLARRIQQSKVEFCVRHELMVTYI